LELERFVSDVCRRKKIKAPPKFERAVEIGRKIMKTQEKKTDLNPNEQLLLKQEGSILKIVELIKENDFEEFKKYLEDNKVGIPEPDESSSSLMDLNSRLHLIVGYEDQDFEGQL